MTREARPGNGAGLIMSEKNATEKHDYYIQSIMEDWQSFTEFVFSDSYCEFDFSNAKAKMEAPIYPRVYDRKYVSIKGYIDIFVSGVRAKIKDRHDDDCPYRNIDYCIEVKSFIKSITETMRQINTHRTYMPSFVPYVVASPDNRYKDIFSSQDVIYIELEPKDF